MEASLNQDRTIFIQETISGTNLMQGDFSNRRLIGSTVQSFKMQDGRCRYLRAQGTRFQNFSIDHVLCDQGNYQDCAWSGLEVRNSFLTGSHFSGCTFEVTMGELSSFGLSFFSDCKLQGSRLSEVSFSGTWWKNCRFEQEDYFLSAFPLRSFLKQGSWDAVCKRSFFGRQPLFVALLRNARSTNRYSIRPDLSIRSGLIPICNRLQT